MKRRRAAALVAGLGLVGGACGPEPPIGLPPDDDAVEVPARGTAGTFDVATWNVEWFGSPSSGPSDESKQLRRVRDVILGAELELWAVQEISGGSSFRELLGQLDGYGGLLADDASVQDGPDYYDDFDGTELKVGIVFKDAAVEVLDARLVLTGLDFEFGGRPPLELRLRMDVDDVSHDVTVIVLHAKAADDVPSWERRAAAAAGLKDHLDSEWPDEPVVVLGDWNDDIDESITAGRDTPYRPFLDDASSWPFATAPLTAAGETSILGFDDVIDHILLSNESAAWLEPNSVEVWRLDEVVDDYEESTSDHLPVLVRLRLAG